MIRTGPSQPGFTLIELLVVITVTATMLSLAIPSFRNFIGSQRVKAVSYDLTTSLVLARSEAVKRNADVTVAPAAASDWTQGWSVTVGGATTLQQQQALTGVTITKAGATIPANDFYFLAAQTTRQTIAPAATATGMNGTVLVTSASVADGVVYSAAATGLPAQCRWDSHPAATIPGIVFIQLFLPGNAVGQTCPL